MSEEWKAIEGYEGKYEVSDMGNVRSLDYTNMQPHPQTGEMHPYTYKGQLIAKQKINSGYLTVGLRDEHGKCMYLMHRLVAKAFVPNPKRYHVVNHINENKTDNRAVNLEWVTYAENSNYGNAKKKLSATHLNHANLSKAIIATDKEGNTTTYPSANEAARQTGINVSNIVRCCNKVKNYNTAGGYKWEYQL